MLLEKPAPILIAAETTLTEALRESFPTRRSREIEKYYNFPISIISILGENFITKNKL